MSEDKGQKELSPLESFLQFDDSNLTAEQKDLQSVAALIMSAFWLLMVIVRIAMGPLWFLVATVFFFKLLRIGLKSNKKLLSIIAIVLYVIHLPIYTSMLWVTIHNIFG